MLLQEIQDGAVNADADITTVLRKCLVLAARLGHDGFRTWVEHELNGYKGKEELPPYRVLHLQSLGTFVGPFGAQAKNVPLPKGNVPTGIREVVTTLPLVDPIAALVTLTQQNRDLESPWPADVTAAVADKFIDRMNLVRAWRVVAAAAQPPPERVNQIFNNYIMGSTNIAMGSSGFSQVGRQVAGRGERGAGPGPADGNPSRGGRRPSRAGPGSRRAR